MSIAAGRLRHWVTLERYDYVRDSNGDVIQDPNSGETIKEWVFITGAWAAIEPANGREFVASQAIQSEITGKLIIRYRDDIDSTCRAVHQKMSRTMYYNILNGELSDKNSGLEYLEMPVSQGLTDGQ